MRMTSPFALLGFLAIVGCGTQKANNESAENKNASAVKENAGAASISENDVAPAPRAPEGIVYKSVLALRQHAEGQPELRGGQAAESTEWPASLYATFKADQGGFAACTAALVGPQAVLTAGHCVPRSGRITVVFGSQYSASCEVHPSYWPQAKDLSADYSLCKTSQPIPVPRGFKFESIDTRSMDHLVQQQIVLGGYGCISDVAKNAQTDGLYRIGYNTVDETSDSPARKRGYDYYRSAQLNNLITRDDPNVANLCPGDSGGPAFKANPAPGNPFGSRIIIGVNSRVFRRTPTEYGASLVSATGGPDFRTWALGWLGRNQVAACGLAGAFANCRH